MKVFGTFPKVGNTVSRQVSRPSSGFIWSKPAFPSFQEPFSRLGITKSEALLKDTS